MIEQRYASVSTLSPRKDGATWSIERPERNAKTCFCNPSSVASAPTVAENKPFAEALDLFKRSCVSAREFADRPIPGTALTRPTLSRLTAPDRRESKSSDLAGVPFLAASVAALRNWVDPGIDVKRLCLLLAVEGAYWPPSYSLTCFDDFIKFAQSLENGLQIRELHHIRAIRGRIIRVLVNLHEDPCNTHSHGRARQNWNHGAVSA